MNIEFGSPTCAHSLRKILGPEIFMVVEIFTDFDLLSIIEFQIYSFILPILQANLGKILAKMLSNCYISKLNIGTWSKSLVFRNYFFLWISTLQSPNQKTKLDGMFIFWCWFFDFFSVWPIKSADLQNPGFQPKIWTRWHVQKYLI